MRSLRVKTILVLAVVILVAGGTAALLLRSPGKKQETEKETAPRVEPVNQLPIKERPFTSIIPRADGREVMIVVDHLNSASEVEYELEYQAGKLLQGAFGKIDFSKEEAPVQRNILLGSCSAGGKCSYHEDVNGGTLLLRYLDGEVVALKGEWNFQLMSQQQGRFTSRDAKFTFDVGKNGLSARTFVIVAQTMGLPGPVDGEIIGGPYIVTLPKGIYPRTKEISLTMHTNTTDPNLKLLGWTEAGWIEYEVKQSGKTLEASVDQPTTFVAITITTPNTP